MNLPFLLLLQAALFLEPSGWKVADPSKLPPSIKIGFVGKKEGAISPSFNYVTEKTTLSQEEFTDLLKEKYGKERKRHATLLGPISAPAGSGTLLQIDTLDTFAHIRQWQSIWVIDGTAHILTTTSSKENFNSKVPLSIFQSFRLVENPLDAISDLARKLELTERIQNASTSHSQILLEKWVDENFSDMGVYWKIQLFKQILNNIE